jgi:hypothetical protein
MNGNHFGYEKSVGRQSQGVTDLAFQIDQTISQQGWLHMDGWFLNQARFQPFIRFSDGRAADKVGDNLHIPAWNVDDKGSSLVEEVVAGPGRPN